MCSESGMEEPRNRYILLNDRVGELLERSLLTLAMSFFMTPPKLLKGELLEALPGNEHSSDPTKIALGGIDRKIRVECGMEDIMKLTVQEADLLSAISSLTLSVPEKLPGVVWFKGELPSSPGTLFGIELNKNPGFGTSDGTFQNKRYFRCAPDSGVFVGLDKLAPFEDDNSELRTPSNSPKRDDHGQVNFESRLVKTRSLSYNVQHKASGKSDLKFLQPRCFDTLNIGQRVVTFCDKGAPLRGTVRYTGDAEDLSGQVQSVVGLELDERNGSGTGKWKGHQLFVCRRDHACFVDIETIMLEEDFDKDAERAKEKATKQDKQLSDPKMQERRLDKEIPTMSYNVQRVQREASGIEDQKTIEVPRGFELGTMVEVPVLILGQPTFNFGVIRWIGYLPLMKDKLIVGLELEQKRRYCSDGTFNGKRYFLCEPKRGFFCMLANCRKDSRLTPNSQNSDNIPSCKGEQFEENASSRQSTSLDSTSLQQALEDLQQLKNENNSLKLEKWALQLEKNDVQEENKELVVQNNSLQTDLRAKKSQVHELETSLTTAQQTLEDIEQLKDENNGLKLEKCHLEKEKNDVQEENKELVVQNNSLQRDLTAKESQVLELETSLTTAQQALEDILQQVKDEHNRLKLEKCQLEKEKNDVQEEKDEVVVQNNSLQTNLRAREARVHELETFLTTALPALDDMHQMKIEHDSLKLEKRQLEKEKNDVQEAKDELVVENNSLQTDLRAKEAQVHRLETTLATAQRALEECQQIKEHCDWEVSRDEVQITDRCLGVGGWGKVSLGTFRGCKVAVKEIHELILSPYNRRLFEREMNIASKCRHPCLLQFIGATNDDGIPLFITELLETSLRALLEQRQLADTEISIISLDVSLALNYLHNMKPSPILHRDVSSANVLLWRQGDQWRGKLSDYGTANFVQQTMTRTPGAAIYSAPEAVSSNQTPKVDVFSFGVLLCEMCIREMPDPERRNEQVRRVRSPSLGNLVRECLRTDPAERPDMARIIQDIETFKGSNSCEARVNSNSRQTAAAAVRGRRRISEASVRIVRAPALRKL
ncbi:uncharacterized protein [Acropora muricata]|uniref:uncharacterized protein isoform X2 n=1 Tax=Acropora muricata TaxID=159855 RepID=UPI0034E4C232